MNVYPSAEWYEGLDADIEALRRQLHELRQLRAARRAAMGIYTCSVCGENAVDAEGGFDTCPDCASRT